MAFEQQETVVLDRQTALRPCVTAHQYQCSFFQINIPFKVIQFKFVLLVIK